MRSPLSLTVLIVAMSVVSRAGSPITDKRDQALAGIKSCLKRNEVSSRECRHLKQDVLTLVDVYKSGDKSVLPILFQFTYLTDFYDEALLTDADGFLSAMSHLPEKNQKEVEMGIAGGMYGLRDADRFKAIRNGLANVPIASPIKAIAEASLKVVEQTNASFIVEYFPPQTFTGPGAQFSISWYSREMFALGEKSLWPPSDNSQEIYRLTYLPAFTGPLAVAFTFLPDGRGQANIKALDVDRERIEQEKILMVSREQTAEFSQRLSRARFWDLATESQHRGSDGAEWILEGIKGGKYHIVDRWCPNSRGNFPEDAAFANAARFLLRLAGKQSGGC